MGLIECSHCHGTGKVPDPDARCRCGHQWVDHHWNGKLGGRCCTEVDRYEVCGCRKFTERED